MLTIPHSKIFTCHQIFHTALDLRLIFWHEEELDEHCMWRVWGTVEVYAGFWWGDLRERDHLEDLGMGGKIRLKLIMWKSVENAWTGLVWFRTRTRGGLL